MIMQVPRSKRLLTWRANSCNVTKANLSSGPFSRQPSQTKVMNISFPSCPTPRDSTSNLNFIESEWHRINQTLMSTFQNIKWGKTDPTYMVWSKLAQTVFWDDNEVD